MEDRKQPALRLYYCGHEECMPGHNFGPATRQHYLIHFVLKGRGKYQAGGQVFPLEEGTAFLIRPHEVTYYEADEEQPWEYAWIAFDGEEAERLLQEYKLIKGRYICELEHPEQTKSYLERLVELFLGGRCSREAMMGYFYLVFSGIRKVEEAQEKAFDKDYFDKAQEYIRYNYGYDIQVTDIAIHVGIDRTYLYKIFMKYCGESPKQYLTAFRVKAAAEMLQNTHLSVTEIALSCGFHDSSVFCKNFSRLIGKSPRKFKEPPLFL